MCENGPLEAVFNEPWGSQRLSWVLSDADGRGINLTFFDYVSMDQPVCEIGVVYDFMPALLNIWQGVPELVAMSNTTARRWP
jgi:hypothetical protein